MSAGLVLFFGWHPDRLHICVVSRVWINHPQRPPRRFNFEDTALGLLCCVDSINYTLHHWLCAVVYQ